MLMSSIALKRTKRNSSNTSKKAKGSPEDPREDQIRKTVTAVMTQIDSNSLLR